MAATSVPHQPPRGSIDTSMGGIRRSGLLMYIVRHGESEANINKSTYAVKPDHAMELTQVGRKMASGAGRWIRDDLSRRFGSKHGLTTVQRAHVRLWVSPFVRTRQTAERILDELNPPKPWEGHEAPVPERWVDSVRETGALAEQDFGVFEASGSPQVKPVVTASSSGEASTLPPQSPTGQSTAYELERMRINLKDHFAGMYWSRPPQGESLFDVSNRLHSFLTEVVQDAVEPDPDRLPIKVVIIVSHGNTIRGLVHKWCRFSPEWVAASVQPPNCSVQVVDEGQTYRGFGFPGYAKTPKHRRDPAEDDAPAEPVPLDPSQTPLIPDSRSGAWEQWVAA